MSKNVNPTHNLNGRMSEIMRFWMRFSFKCAMSHCYGMYKIVQSTSN
jgi:hypothetical protein